MSRPLCVAALALGVATSAMPAEEGAGHFDDPFLQVTGAIPDCPQQHRSTYTRDQMRAEAHSRAERGTRCFLEGRCRLPSSYDYDKEIIPRAKKAILADGRFAGTSIWIEGQRRRVWLKGCVRTRAEAVAVERLARRVDDVERIVSELVVKPR